MREMPGWRTVISTIIALPVLMAIMAPLAVLFAVFLYCLLLLGLIWHYFGPRRLALPPEPPQTPPQKPS